MKRFLVIALTALLIFPVMSIAGDIKSLLMNPETKYERIFLNQPVNIRLDMLDYYTASSKNFTADERYSSPLRIDSLSETHVRFGSNTQLSVDYYLFANARDTMIVQVLNTPVGNGDVSVEFVNLKTPDRTETLNVDYTDWLKDPKLPSNENAIRAAVPFVTARAEADPGKGILRLVNSAIEVPGLDEEIVSSFREELTFKWNGGKFVKQK